VRLYFTFVLRLCSVALHRRKTSGYLIPLSYGIPSAFGALDFFDVNARTISDTMYGSII